MEENKMAQSNRAIIIPATKKDEFLKRTKGKNSFEKLMERSAKATQVINFEWHEGT